MNDTPQVHVQRPAVVGWFWAYCALTVVCSFGWLVAIVIAFLNEKHVDEEEAIGMLVMAALMLPTMAAYAVAPLLPRRQWVWIYDLVLICLGLSSCCCLPITVPLLIYWLRPDTKAWFDAGAAGARV